MKLLHKLLIITLVPLICITGMSYIYFDRLLKQMEKQIDERLSDYAKDVKYHFQTSFQHVDALTGIISKDTEIHQAIIAKNIRQLNRKISNYMKFGQASGILLLTNDFKPVSHFKLLFDPSHINHLMPLLQLAKTFPQSEMIDIDNNLYVLSVYALKQGAALNGFVIAGKPVDPDIYQEIVQHLQIQMTLTYKQTSIGIDPVTHSHHFEYQKRFPIQVKTVSFDLTIYENNSISKTIIKSRTELLVLALIILSIFIIFIIAVVNHLISPINHLIKAMQQYSKGELRLSLLPDTKHEIGNLYSAFHRMIIDIEHAEQRFRRIFDHAIEGIFQSHPDGYLIRANPALARIFGFLDPDEMIAHISDLGTQLYVDADDRSRFKAMMSKQDLMSDFEAQMYKKDGTIFWVSLNARNVRNKEGNLLYYEGFLLDIDTRKRAENQDQEHKALEIANQTKSEFLANISHEIRTPLNAVLGLGKLLQKTPLSETQKDYLSDMLHSSKTLLELINDILDYSKIELNKITLNEKPFVLIDIFQTIISMFKHQVQSKNMAIIFHLAPECNIELIGDPVRVRQIMVNLVGNAVKFTEKGQIWVQTESLHQTPESIYISISVTDTGIGIQEADQKRIFQAFSQTEASTNRRYSGAGLGLAICEKLVKFMNGKMFVTSAPSQGSTFTITIPFPYTENKESTQSSKIYSRVLMVEDDPINARFAQTVLKGENIDVDILSNGLTIKNQLSNNLYDMVFMDIQLPETNGQELTRMIRGDGFVSIPIIALTACAMKGDREKCLASGMNDYLAKPFEPEDIMEMYHKWKGAVQDL